MKQELVNRINDYLANVAVMYIKLHNLHWNVVGSQFKAVHEYLEALYDGFSESLDSVAEILKMNGEMPLASLKDYLAAASVQELDSSEIQIKEAIHITLEDLQLLEKLAREIRLMAVAEDQFDVISHFEDELAQYSKNIWFIKAMLK